MCIDCKPCIEVGYSACALFLQRFIDSSYQQTIVPSAVVSSLLWPCLASLLWQSFRAASARTSVHNDDAIQQKSCTDVFTWSSWGCKAEAACFYHFYIRERKKREVKPLGLARRRCYPEWLVVWRSGDYLSFKPLWRLFADPAGTQSGSVL